MSSPVVIPPAAPDPPAPAGPSAPRPERTVLLLVLGVLLFTALALMILKWFPQAHELYLQMTVLLGAFAGALLLKLNPKG